MQLEKSIFYARIAARVLSGMLFIFWGSFFIEHLSWFFHESDSPPLHVWVLQSLHFFLLVGYLALFKWERLGSGIVVVCSATFFGFAAGANGIAFILVSALPALLLLYCWRNEGRKKIFLAK